MFIWLPPSEGKTAPKSGPTFDLDALAYAELRERRQEVLEAIRTWSMYPENSELDTAPSGPAIELFTGVLYNASELAKCYRREPEFVDSMVRIFSGFFGVLRPADMVPDHRLAMGTRHKLLPGLPSFWKKDLDAVLRAEVGGQVVLDLRSGGYKSACPARWANLIEVAAVRDVDGVRKVISHDAKKWRGLLVRELMLKGNRLTVNRTQSIDDLREVLSVLGTSLSTTDAKGQAHRVHYVEFSEPITHKDGGTHTTATLVTD